MNKQQQIAINYINGKIDHSNQTLQEVQPLLLDDWVMLYQKDNDKTAIINPKALIVSVEEIMGSYSDLVILKKL